MAAVYAFCRPMSLCHVAGGSGPPIITFAPLYIFNDIIGIDNDTEASSQNLMISISAIECDDSARPDARPFFSYIYDD